MHMIPARGPQAVLSEQKQFSASVLAGTLVTEATARRTETRTLGYLEATVYAIVDYASVTQLYIYIYTRIYFYVYACVYIYMYVYIHEHVYMCVHEYMHIF